MGFCVVLYVSLHLQGHCGGRVVWGHCHEGTGRRDGHELKKEDSSEGNSLEFWKLNCLCWGVADAPENYLQDFAARVKLVLKCLESLQEIVDVYLMFLFWQKKGELGYSCD